MVGFGLLCVQVHLCYCIDTIVQRRNTMMSTTRLAAAIVLAIIAANSSSSSAFSTTPKTNNKKIAIIQSRLNIFGNAFSNDDSLGARENAGLKKGPQVVEVTVNGKPVKAVAGQKVSKVMAAARVKMTYR